MTKKKEKHFYYNFFIFVSINNILEILITNLKIIIIIFIISVIKKIYIENILMSLRK